VFFFDEGRFGLKSTLTRIWAKRGTDVKIKKKDGYESFYVYSSVSPYSGKDFNLFLPEVNTAMMNIYLRELSKEYSDKEIMMIMDQAGWHKSKELKIPSNIKLLFLPPYSPELNPVEKLWRWIRIEATHNWVFDYLGQLMDAVQKAFIKLTAEKLSRLCSCSYLLSFK
jgi:transposase